MNQHILRGLRIPRGILQNAGEELCKALRNQNYHANSKRVGHPVSEFPYPGTEVVPGFSSRIQDLRALARKSQVGGV